MPTDGLLAHLTMFANKERLFKYSCTSRPASFWGRLTPTALDLLDGSYDIEKTPDKKRRSTWGVVTLIAKMSGSKQMCVINLVEHYL